jgi:thiamine pyrophosphokinase
LIPEILTGDFDSVRLDAIRSNYPELQVISTPDQDQSDLEKAVAVACDLGAEAITVIGAAGGRMDHTLANTALLMSATIPISLADDFGTVRAICCDRREGSVDAGALLETSEGDTVSLITFDMGTSVTVTGVHWPLNRFHLQPGTRGVSNVALASSVAVTVHCGSVFVCHLYEAAMKVHSEITVDLTPGPFPAREGENGI